MTKKLFIYIPILLFSIIPVFGVNIDGAFSSCSGTQSVSNISGTENVNLGSGISTSYNGTVYQCNKCFYGGHLYVGQNRGNWSDTFSNTSSSETYDLINNFSWWSTKRLNANFVWGDSFLNATSPLIWSIISNASSAYDGKTYYRFAPNTSLKYSESSGAISLNSIGTTTTQMRGQPGYLVSFNAGYVKVFDAASGSRGKDAINDGLNFNHVQCSIVFPRWCGDNVIDTDKSEQCDDGNMTNGDGCSSTCTTETSSLVCNNLTLAPTTLTKNGGDITATCVATNATQYKFVLKQGSTVIDTKPYQTSTQATFTLPANSTTSSKNYTVDCLVKNATHTDITATSCNKTITVPGTTTEPSSCDSLTLGFTTAEINTPVSYVCRATNATSYIIKQGSTVVGYMPESTITFTTAGTYSIGCFIDGKTDTPVACAKNITITNPPVSTKPSIFIDKDDSTPGTPDSDGNDIQRVQINGTATFSVRVLNSGDEALKTVVINDPLASDCDRTSTQTAALYSGGTSTNFDIGESFTYECTKSNVTSSTFTNNRNTASVRGIGVTSLQNVSDSDITEIFIKQGNPDISIEKDDADDLDDTQEIEKNDTANFSVKVTNSGKEPLDNIRISDELSPDCEKDTDETRELIKKFGNKDNIFDPGEEFAYTCDESSVTKNTFPDEKNTVCIDAMGVDTDQDVSDCDDTEVILSTVEKPLVCENIESSKGSFGGAPFQTEITCQTADESSKCVIEISKDGEILQSYSDCVKEITFENTGNYTVACIVDDEASQECEMEIEVAAMTDVPTGTKILILAFLSLILTAIGIHYHKKKAV